VIIPVGVLVIADRLRVASIPVHAALLGNVAGGEPASSWRRFSGRSGVAGCTSLRVAGLSAFWVAGFGAFRVVGLDH